MPRERSDRRRGRRRALLRGQLEDLGTLRRLLSAPVRRAEVLLGKTLGVAFVAGVATFASPYRP